MICNVGLSKVLHKTQFPGKMRLGTPASCCVLRASRTGEGLVLLQHPPVCPWWDLG